MSSSTTWGRIAFRASAAPCPLGQDLIELGVRVANLDRYRCSEQPWQGLVLGYGNVADHQVDQGVALLATAIHQQ